MPLPDIRPSELVEIIRAIRGGAEVPECLQSRPPTWTICRIVCITTDDVGVGHWCDLCPYGE